MTPATYAKGGAGAHIDYTTVDSDYGRVLVAATQKGIAAVFLGDNDRTLEKNLKHDFPAADITRNDDALGPRVKGVLARLYGRKPSALDAARRAARHRRHGLPVEGLEGADRRSRPGETRTYGEIARRIGAPGSARAVGRACATNQAAGVIPCHRAVGASGALTGYRWGVARKERLLADERRAQQHVKGAAAAMPRVRCPHGAHAMAVVGTVQPAHELAADAAAQHAAALQPQALAGDDQHDAQIACDDVLEKGRDGAFGGGQRHAMQVERGLRCKLAARQGAGDVAVEILIVDCEFRRPLSSRAQRGTFPGGFKGPSAFGLGMTVFARPVGL